MINLNFKEKRPKDSFQSLFTSDPECDPDLVIQDSEKGRISMHDLTEIKIQNLIFNPKKMNFSWTSENTELLMRMLYSYNHDWKKIVYNFCKKVDCFFARKELQSKITDFRQNSARNSKDMKNLPYSAEEIEKLNSLITIHGKDWKTLSKYFKGRTPESLRNKYYYLKSGGKKSVSETSKKIKKCIRSSKRS